MINITDLPATMPGSMKDQLLALAPFMTDRLLKMNGGFVVDMKIPIDSFLTFGINHEALAEHGMSVSVQVESPEPILDGSIVKRARYADVQLTYL